MRVTRVSKHTARELFNAGASVAFDLNAPRLSVGQSADWVDFHGVGKDSVPFDAVVSDCLEWRHRYGGRGLSYYAVLEGPAR